MRDPRLAEIEFLSVLSKQDVAQVSWIVDRSKHSTYGLTDQEYRELILHCLLNGLVNGPSEMVASRSIFGPQDHFRTIDESLDSALKHEVGEFLAGRHCALRLNHTGRLRLWQLRDDLLATRRLEPFAILNSPEYWERDLEIAFAFLPLNAAVTVMIADLDNFKKVNDTLGHPVGDDVLRRYLQCVRDLTERFGDAYRLGGDEVVVILPSFDATRSKALASGLCSAVATTLGAMEELKPLAVKPTVSVGAKSFAARQDSTAIYKAVDDLLKKAKGAGKNQAIVGE